MAATYEPIASTTLGSAAADITISSIPGTFTDLVVICDLSGASTGNAMRYLINGDTGSNYSFTELSGNGSAASSNRLSSQSVMYATLAMETSSTGRTPFIAHFMSYANTAVYKTVLQSSLRADVAVSRSVGLWRSTSAITSLKFYMPSYNIAAGSTVSLYGIKAA